MTWTRTARRVWLANSLLVATAGAALAFDPKTLEVHPYRERVVVQAAWGDGMHQFGPLSYKGEQERPPGPFWVAEDGRIYIADCRKCDVKLFGLEGRWERTVALPKGKDIIDDLVVAGRHVYWLGQTPWGIGVFRQHLETGEWSRVPVTPNPDLTQDEKGSPVWGRARLRVEEGGVRLFNRVTGWNYPLVVEGALKTESEQDAGRVMGLPVGGGPRVAVAPRRVEARSGEEADWGDVVQVLPDGAVEKVLLRRPGHLCDVDREGTMLLSKLVVQGGRELFVLDVRTMEGRLLSRTLQPHREFLDVIGENRHRMTPDGHIYEITVGRETGVRILELVWRD